MQICGMSDGDCTVGKKRMSVQGEMEGGLVSCRVAKEGRI